MISKTQIGCMIIVLPEAKTSYLVVMKGEVKVLPPTTVPCAQWVAVNIWW